MPENYAYVPDDDDCYELLKLIAVLYTAFIVGSIFKLAKLPAAIGEIIVGICYGPYALNIIPYPDAVCLIDQLGLILLVLEGGLHIDLATLKDVWFKATCVALTGTGLPVLLAWAVMPRFNAFSNTEGLVMGTCLSSMAIAMATTFMKDFDLLHTRLGKLICCAAMIDDIASLILLAIISSTVGDESQNINDEPVNSTQSPCENTATEDFIIGQSEYVVWGPKSGTWAIVIPILTSLGFIAVSLVCVYFLPKVIECLRSRIESNGGKIFGIIITEEIWSDCVLFLLLAYTTGGLAVAHYIRTTFLLGPFMAGVAFSSIKISQTRTVLHDFDQKVHIHA